MMAAGGGFLIGAVFEDADELHPAIAKLPLPTGQFRDARMTQIPHHEPAVDGQFAVSRTAFIGRSVSAQRCRIDQNQIKLFTQFQEHRSGGDRLAGQRT